VRPEFEYEVSIADAERMLATICGDDTLEKKRFFVEDTGASCANRGAELAKVGVIFAHCRGPLSVHSRF
jgi:CYTH domain-containing protein